MPCSPRRAHRLLRSGRAPRHKHTPFTIRLVDRTRAGSAVQPLRVKLDPGSKTTGIAIVREAETTQVVLGLIELHHRGQLIHKKMTARRQMRRAPRSHHTRDWPARFDNCGNKNKGWLVPSLMHRVDTTMAWVKRLGTLCPLEAISVEQVRFDMQKMVHPKLADAPYQQGELQGYEVREYLLEKWRRTCAYCDAKDTSLEIDHIVPRSRSGSDRVSNLSLACHDCNQKKGAQAVAMFLAHDPARLQRVCERSKAPLGDAAAVNATRLRLVKELSTLGLPIETSTGGRTKYNRRLGIAKTHALDAACVGAMAAVEGWQQAALSIGCSGRGSYQRTRRNTYDFARGYLVRRKQVHGFQTGDLIRATVGKGKKAGIYQGRVEVRAMGSFNVQTQQSVIQGIGWRCCTLLQRGDGYSYHMPRGGSLHVTQNTWTHISSRTGLARGPYLPALKGQVSQAL